MVRVSFTKNIQRLVPCPPTAVEGATVREALDAAFAENPRARGYFLDDRGALRKHIVVFLGAEPVRDRERLSDPVPEGAEIHVFQALSGG